jgi:adhesin transport system outer membrane protein
MKFAHRLLAVALCLGVGNPLLAQVPKGVPRAAKRAARKAPPPAAARPMHPAPDLALPADPFGAELGAVLGLIAQRNPTISAARIDAQAAGVDVRSAKWQRAPTFSVQGSVYGVQGGAPNRATPSATVALPVWTGGRISAGIRRATMSRDAAEARLRETQQEVTFQAIQQFYEYKRLSERIDTMDRDLHDLTVMQGSMERRVEQGVSARSDYELARTRTLQVRMMRDAQIAQRQGSLQRLRELVDDTGYQLALDGLNPAFTLHAELDELVQAADAQDPRRKRLEAEAAVARAEAKAAAAARLPGLNVEYSYDDVYHHRVGLALKAQGTGLAEFSVAKAAALREGAAGQRVDAAAHDLRSQVINDFVDYTSARARLEVAALSGRSSDAVKDSYMRQFAAGKRTWFDVMNAVREALTARLDTIDLRYAAGLAQLRLLVRLGASPVEPPAEPSVENKGQN